MAACRGLHIELIRFLIGKGISINAVNNAGETALSIACIGEQVAHIAFATSAVLHRTTDQRNIDIVELLIKHGAVIDPWDRPAYAATLASTDITLNDNGYIVIENNSTLQVWSVEVPNAIKYYVSFDNITNLVQGETVQIYSDISCKNQVGETYHTGYENVTFDVYGVERRTVVKRNFPGLDGLEPLEVNHKQLTVTYNGKPNSFKLYVIPVVSFILDIFSAAYCT